MKTKKRLGKRGFALILALLLAFSPAAAFAAEVEGNVPESKTVAEKTAVQETKATEPTAEAATEPAEEAKPEEPATEETEQTQATETTRPTQAAAESEKADPISGVTTDVKDDVAKVEPISSESNGKNQLTTEKSKSLTQVKAQSVFSSQRASGAGSTSGEGGPSSLNDRGYGTGHLISVDIVKVTRNGASYTQETIGTRQEYCVDTNNHSSGNHSLKLKHFHPTKNGLNTDNWKGYSVGSYYNGGCNATFSAFTGNNVYINCSIVGKKDVYKASYKVYLVYDKPVVEKAYTLSYDANSGYNAPAAQTGKSTTGSYKFTISTQRPMRDGHTFQGWQTQNGDTTYQPGGSITISANTTLYAVWQKDPEQVNLTYIDRGIKYKTQTCDKGKNIQVEGCGNIRDGYVFKGWSASPDANRVDYEPGDTITMDGSKTLYAVWERTPVTANYTVKWMDENGQPIKEEETRSGNIGETVSANDNDKRVPDYTYERSKSIESAVLKNTGTVLILCFTKNKPNLNITKSADQATAKVGDIITYTIQVTNTGNAAAKNVVITDQLPKGLEIQTAVLDGISVSPYNGSVTVASLEVGKTATLVITAKALESGRVINSASVTSDGNSIPSDTDSATVEVTEPDPIPEKGLEVTKTRTSGETAKVGDTITWDIVIKNTTNAEKTVKVEDLLSNGRTVTLTNAGGSQINSGSVSVKANGEVTLKASYVAQESDIDQTLENTVIVTDNNTPDDKVTGKDQGTKIEPADPQPENVTIKIEYVDKDGNVLKTEEKEVEKDGSYDVSGDIPSTVEINGQKYTTEVSGEGDPASGTADGDKTVKVICAPEDTDPTDPVGPTNPTDPTAPGTDPIDPGTDPTEPTTPGTDPTDPGTDPTEPATPGTNPTDPTGPVGSTTPNDPTTPTVPGGTTDPVAVPAGSTNPAGTTDGVATTQNLPAATPVAAIQPATPVAPMAAPAAAPVMTAVADDEVPLAVPEENDQGLESLEDDQVPLANKLSAQWALLNLILAILTVLISAVLLIGYFTRKKHEEDDNGEEVEIKKKGFTRVLSLLPALVGVILFILTEDMTNPMVFTDKWTIWMAVIALLNVIVAFFAKKKEQDEDEDNGQNYGMA